MSYWSSEYATGYIISPMIGAFLASIVFKFQKAVYERIDHSLNESVDQLNESDISKESTNKSESDA